MKSLYTKIIRLRKQVTLFCLLFFVGCTISQAVTVSYQTDGSQSTFTIPAGVTSLTVKAWGATESFTLGQEGFAQGDIPVSAGQQYIAVVDYGATGYGLSGFFLSSITQANARIIGGSTGQSMYHPITGGITLGGVGGGSIGGSAADAYVAYNGIGGGGTGGSQSSGGLGGVVVGDLCVSAGLCPPTLATNGTALLGGTGGIAQDADTFQTEQGGGGGGGYWGGGGGGATGDQTASRGGAFGAGGGGGSNYVSGSNIKNIQGTPTNPSTLIGTRTNTSDPDYCVSCVAGKVAISYTGLTGTVVVSSDVSASWTISGPVTITGSGVSQTSASQPVGSYTITWGTVSGYPTPAPQTLTLTNGGTITFNGKYAVPIINLWFTILNKIQSSFGDIFIPHVFAFDK
jgi:hypothetical protein